MKGILVALLSVLTFSGALGESFIQCFVSNDTDVYAVTVNIDNMEGGNFPGLNHCDTDHRENKTDADVQRIRVIGQSTIIPSVICRTFKYATEFIATQIMLQKLQNFAGCENLQILDLSGNNITKFSANQFSANPDLRHLDLSRNKILQTDEDSLYNLELLNSLNLSENPEIQIDPYFFQHATNLTYLDISKCGLQAIPVEWMNNITNLIQLDISSNPLGSIPSTIFQNVRKLQTLRMDNCSLTELAEGQFYFNSALTYLNMRSNEFKTLEETLLRNQTSLITLLLSYNSFEDLPDDVFKSLENLRVIEMNFCNLYNLKVSWFASMSQLRSLSLTNNHIQEIPYKTFGVENNLEAFYMQNNELEVLDATSFALLRNLKHLRVENNKIRAIDSHFLQQPEVLNTVWFSDNVCVDVNLNDFYKNLQSNLELFKDCFYNFDQIPVETTTLPNETNYRWFSMRWNTLVVHVKAHSNVSIVFSNILSEEQGSSLKIQIGMERNLKTFIYDNNTKVWERETRGILDENEWRSFVISWDYKVLQFYKESWQLPRAMYIIAEPFDINFFGVRADTNASFFIQRIEDNFLHEDFPAITHPVTTTELPETST